MGVKARGDHSTFTLMRRYGRKSLQNPKTIFLACLRYQKSFPPPGVCVYVQAPVCASSNISFDLTKPTQRKRESFCRRRRRRSALLSQLAIRSAAISTTTTIMNAISRSFHQALPLFLVCLLLITVFAISSTVGQKKKRVSNGCARSTTLITCRKTNGWLTGRADVFRRVLRVENKVFPITSSVTSRQMDVVTRPKNTSNESQSRCRLEFQEMQSQRWLP